MILCKGKKLRAQDFFEMVVLNTSFTKGEDDYITLWTLTATAVPTCPLSFCAAASLSRPSSLSP